ncbi:MAG: von Willebrand factor type A domain-containing protein [Verrucomicrobiales bacterium]|nr:von Willebrand factor type A domain-containing protein [Verrucomicrobiales bacterium]
MNDSFSQLSRTDLEAKVTAMVLGELAPAEAAALQAWLAKDPELLEWQRRLERTLIRVREAVSNPGEPTGVALEARRLSEGRRDQLLQQLRRGRATHASEPSSGETTRVIPVRFEAEPGRVTREFGAGSLALAAGLVALLSITAFLFTTDTLSGRGVEASLASLSGERTPILITGALADSDSSSDLTTSRFGLKVASEEKERTQFRGFAVTATNSMAAFGRALSEDSLASVPQWKTSSEPMPPPPHSASGPSVMSVRPAVARDDWALQTAAPEAIANQVPSLGDQPMVGLIFRVAANEAERGRGATPTPASPVRGEVEVLRKQVPADLAAAAGRGIKAGVLMEGSEDSGASKDVKLAVPLPSVQVSAGSAVTRFGNQVVNAPTDEARVVMEPRTMARATLHRMHVGESAGQAESSPSGGAGGGAVNDKLDRFLGKAVAADALIAGVGGNVPPPPPREAKQVSERLDRLAEERAESGARNVDEAKAPEAEVAEALAFGRFDSAGRPQAAGSLPAAVPVPVPQSEVSAEQDAFSTFSLNVADVSFKLAEASLGNQALPGAGTIRSEEFLNAFDYHDPQPAAGAPLGFAWDRARDPFTHGRDLLRLAVKTASSGREANQALHLVLVLDNSGSMERADRVRILRECLRVLAEKLGSADRISVVAFARTARLWVEALSGDQAGELLERVGQLTPEGGTNLEDALRVAYETALKHFVIGGGNRVILMTDGAANLGEVRSEVLRQLVVAHRTKGVALDCFGIGWEGYNDEVLEALSRNGDGRYGFVQSPEEASAGFAAQLAGALQVAASDVKVQVEFNPRRVASWRQVGYAKHQLTQEQFRDNTVDAAEIGAAESGNALYVIDTLSGGSGPVAIVRVRFREPASGLYREHAWEVPYTGLALPLDQSRPAFRLAVVASLFAESLADSPFAAEVTSDRLLGLMTGVPAAFVPDPRPGRLEWMIRQAKSLRGR